MDQFCISIKKKKYKGYINAFEALDQRLQDMKMEEEKEKEEIDQEVQDALAQGSDIYGTKNKQQPITDQGPKM